MKKLLTFSFLIICTLSVRSQTAIKTFEMDGKPYVFEKVIQVDSSINKDALYSKGLVWFANNFENSKSVLQVQDRDGGNFIGKSVFTYKFKYSIAPEVTYYMNFMIQLSFKDGKIKYKLYDFSTENEGSSIKDGKIIKYPYSIGHKAMDKYVEASQKAIEDNAIYLTKNIEEYFKNPVKEDW